MTTDPADPASDLGPSFGFQTLLGYRKIVQQADYTRLELEMRAELTNLIGLPHGGVHATLLDAALGGSGCYNGPGKDIRKAVTLNLNVSYLAQPRGTLLIAEGRRIGGGRKIYFAEGSVHDETGLELARATGTFRFVD